MNKVQAIDVVIAVAKALTDWDGSPEQAAEKLGQAVKAVKGLAPLPPPPPEPPLGKPIRRWHHVDYGDFCVLRQEPEGEWVMYSDVKERLARLKAIRSRVPCRWCNNNRQHTPGSNIMREPCSSCVDDPKWPYFRFNPQVGPVGGNRS